MDDKEKLKTVRDEYRQIGHDTELAGNVLTVFSRRRVKPKPKEDKDNKRGRRNNS